MARKAELQPGLRVEVPWGVDTFPGQVIETYESGGALRVRVEVQVPGRAEPETIVLRAEDVITKADEAADALYQGSGAGVRYERHFLNALIDAVSQLPNPASFSLSTQFPVADIRFDALVLGEEAAVAVDIKIRIRELQHYVTGLSARARGLTDRIARPVVVLAVSPSTPQLVGITKNSGLTYLLPNVALLRWRDSRDDLLLKEAIREIFVRDEK
jgi:hypothetical protein